MITTVTRDNVDSEGFFCYMSKPKSEGYKNKLNWLKDRFAEGLVIRKLDLPERGFIEYIPGEYAWRPVHAPEYMFIHCLWVVGKSKGKGYASELLKLCEDDAREKGFKGLAMLVSTKVWLPKPKILLKNGFKLVEEHPPFSLMVKKFSNAPDPYIIDNFQTNLDKCGEGFTVFHANQCPYMPDAYKIVRETAEELGLPCNIVELKSRQDVLDKSPSPFGIFSIVYNGKLMSYAYLLKKDILKRLAD